MNAATFRALADPGRLRILELLGTGPRSVNEVAAALDLRQPQASKHLQTLSRAGLVAVEPRAQRRIYSLRPEAMSSLRAWLITVAPERDARWNRLDEVLDQRPSGGDAR